MILKEYLQLDLSESDLENKILIWGLTAEGLNNPVSTPVGVMYPSQVQASILQTVLQEVRIQQSYYLEFLSHSLLLLVLLGILVMVYKLPTTFAGIGSLVFVGFQVGGSLIGGLHLSFFSILSTHRLPP